MVGEFGNKLSGRLDAIRGQSRSLVATASLGLACCFGACSSDAEPTAMPDVVTEDSAQATDGVAADSATDTFVAVDVDHSQFCQGPVSYQYDPLSGQQFTTFPDDLWTRPDPTSPTGLRVSFDPLLAPWVQASPPILKNAVQDLQTLDGWGVLAGVTLQFSGPVAALAEYATPSAADDLQLVDLSAQPPQPVPFEVQRTDDDRTLILWPLVPLKSRTQYAAFLRRGKNQSQSACVRPSEVLIQLLAGKGGDKAELQQLAPRYQAALQALQLPPADVSAMVVFTTQSTWQQSAEIAKDIAGRQFPWASKAVCTDEKDFRRCDLTLQAADYREGRTVKDGKPVSTYTLPVAVWLPKTGQAPFPTAIFGHGLGSPRTQAKELAQFAAPQGIATIAIDGVKHGDHPGGANPGTIGALLGFFAISAESLSVDGLALRDNWRQSTYDKLQLLEAIEQSGDLDGDGKPELDNQHVSYIGVSLGGIMGAEMLALTPHVGAAVLSVPGARVGTIIRDSEQFGPLIAALKPDGYGDGDVARFFPILQTLIDAGDGGAYAEFVLANRLPGMGPPPQLLLQMAVPDDIVPNSATRSLARALRIPLAPPVVQSISLLPVLNQLPAVATMSTGLTAALFQFDRLREDPGGKVQAANHSDVPASIEAVHQDLHFLGSWLKTGQAEIVDPFAELQTPPLGP